MSNYYQYRIYCNNENKWHYVWDTSPPTACPNNFTHNVNNKSIDIISKINQECYESYNTNENSYNLSDFSNNIISIQLINIIFESQSTGTNGGTFLSNGWRTRVLNDISGNGPAILLNNQFTLTPGVYNISGFCPAYKVGNHQCRLFDITNNLVCKYGTSQLTTTIKSNSNSDSDSMTSSFLEHYMVIPTNTIFRIEHRCENTRNSDGFGISSGFPGNNEIYTQFKIIKMS